jgi:hypothetical protein
VLPHQYAPPSSGVDDPFRLTRNQVAELVEAIIVAACSQRDQSGGSDQHHRKLVAKQRARCITASVSIWDGQNGNPARMSSLATGVQASVTTRHALAPSAKEYA